MYFGVISRIFPQLSKEHYFYKVENSKFYWIIKLAHYSEFHLFIFMGNWFLYQNLLLKVNTSCSFALHWTSQSNSFNSKFLVLVLVISFLKLILMLAMELSSIEWKRSVSPWILYWDLLYFLHFNPESYWKEWTVIKILVLLLLCCF